MIDFVYYLFAILGFAIPLCLFFYKKKVTKTEVNKRNKDICNKKPKVQCTTSKGKVFCHEPNSNLKKIWLDSGNEDVSPMDNKEFNKLYNQNCDFKHTEESRNLHVKFEEINTLRGKNESNENSNFRESENICLDPIVDYNDNNDTIQQNYVSDTQTLNSVSNDFNNETSLFQETEIKRQQYDGVYANIVEELCVIEKIKSDNNTLRDSNNSLKKSVEGLSDMLCLKEKEFGIIREELMVENIKLKSIKCNFEKIIEEKIHEINSIKEHHSSLIEQINKANNDVRQLNTLLLNKEEEFNMKLRSMDANMICLQSTNNDLLKVIKEKICEVEYLKNSNVPLLETVSFNHEVKEMKRRLKDKEEEFATKLKAIEETNNFLKAIIEKREKEVDCKIIDINNLKESEMSLKEKVSVLTLTMEELMKSKSLKDDARKGNKFVKVKKNVNNAKNYELVKMVENNDECCDKGELIKDSVDVDRRHSSDKIDRKNDICDIKSVHKNIVYLSKELSVLTAEMEEYKHNLVTKESLQKGVEINVSDIEILQQEIIVLSHDIIIFLNELENGGIQRTEEVKNLSSEESFVKDHGNILQRFQSLERRWFYLSGFKSNNNNESSFVLHNENKELKIEVEKYRDSLERTEQMLERIQCSVEKEETKWARALQCSEEDCSKLEMKVKDLMAVIDELKPKDNSDLNNTSDNAVVLNNTALSFEIKKKRKHKNKKKVKKHAPESIIP